MRVLSLAGPKGSGLQRGRLGDRGGGRPTTRARCRTRRFYGAAAVTEAEGIALELDARGLPCFNGAASVTEAEGAASLRVTIRNSSLQRGRLGDRGGGGCYARDSSSRIGFNGAASVPEAEASRGRSNQVPPASFNGAASVTEAEVPAKAADQKGRKSLQRGRVGDRGGGRRMWRHCVQQREASTGPPR